MSDPFAFLAPADPLARLLVAHQRTDTAACHCGWAALGESHAEHVAGLIRSAFHRPSGLDAQPPERAILTDLIAEGRDTAGPYYCFDRAEARLREVGG